MIDVLISKIEEYYPNVDREEITKAYLYAEKAHEGQFRNSGEKYFTHPFNVAMILADLHMDTATIIAGLFHDILEDTDITYDEMAAEFGEEVTELVDGVTKLKKLQYKTKQENQAENLRKMVMAMARDIRVIIIKLADRLHNMRTLEYMSDEKKKEKALETLEIYAPLAHRLGISKIKWELEDLSLRYLDPDGYYDLVEKVAKRRREREAYVDEIINDLNDNLDELDIARDISGRPKSFYSIYRKMVYQNKSFEQIFDLTAIRIIVDSVKDCYGVLGIVHTLWKPIPGRFKDYIAMPKPNMYQSLHTTVIGPKGEIFEVQIRTWEMHRTAEYGIAAHWKYKEGTVQADNFDEKLTWLRQLLEWQKELKDPKEFMESLKIDLFTDEVFVFTPRGDVIDLPNGSTPLDFAYRVHTDVGNKCVGAKVDGRIVPLDFKLKNGNIVEVLTSPNSKPSRDWLKVVKSNQAKTKIRQWFKREEKDLNISTGISMVEKELKKLGFKPADVLKDDWLKEIANRLSLDSVDSLYAALGFGSVNISQVVPKLLENYKLKHRDEYEKVQEGRRKEKRIQESKVKKSPSRSRTDEGVSLKGVDNIKVRFAKCCNPVPGDEIVGYITRGRGVSVHRKDCSNIEELALGGQRFIDVYWDDTEAAAYPAEIQVQSSDTPGLLMEITKEIAESKLTMLSLNARTNKEKLVIINMTLEIKNKEQLQELINSIKRMKGVIDAYRVIS